MRYITFDISNRKGILDMLTKPTKVKGQIEFEFGYTPANLKRVREYMNMTQQQAAVLLDVNISTLRRWETPEEKKSHADMPHAAWTWFLTLIGKKNKVFVWEF